MILKIPAVIISQTGGGCRATNYIGFLKKGLKRSWIRISTYNIFKCVGLEKQPGFRITLPFIKKLIMGIIYGDLFMRVLYRVRPYEKVIRISK